jgi:CheY-like chemotaxis protein
MRILVVDDDAVFRQELADLLDEDGHRSTVAPSVPKAIELLESSDFDLVFTDLKMPRHSGMELLADVRSRWPGLLVVMVTGFATVDTAVEAMKLGAFDYLRKPFQPAHLQRIVARAMEELKFQGASRPASSVDAVVARWLAEGLSVLSLTPRSLAPRPGLTVEPLPPEAHLVVDSVEAFLAPGRASGVVLEGLDRLFAQARRGEFLRFVSSLEVRLRHRARFVVTFDPGQFTGEEADELRAALAGPLTRSTLEALSNPIRRAVLRRARDGPISFTQALDAADLDESPKLSFHLRRLLEEGLLGHQQEEYRITARGADALRLLEAWDAAVSDGITTSAALPLGPS